MSTLEIVLSLSIVIFLFGVVVYYRYIEYWLFNRKHDADFTSIGGFAIGLMLKAMAVSLAIKIVYWMCTKPHFWIEWDEFSFVGAFISNILPCIAIFLILISVIKILIIEKTIKRKIFRSIYTLSVFSCALCAGLIAGAFLVLLLPLGFALSGLGTAGMPDRV